MYIFREGRLTLEITDVRVQRLQEITGVDAAVEGCAGVGFGMVNTPMRPSKFELKNFWQDINGDDSWSANPWVWAVTFAAYRRNVDAPLKSKGA